jgi:hypothetical protein
MGADHRITSRHSDNSRIDYFPPVQVQGFGVNSDHPVTEDNYYSLTGFTVNEQGQQILFQCSNTVAMPIVQWVTQTSNATNLTSYNPSNALTKPNNYNFVSTVAVIYQEPHMFKPGVS